MSAVLIIAFRQSTRFGFLAVCHHCDRHSVRDCIADPIKQGFFGSHEILGIYKFYSLGVEALFTSSSSRTGLNSKSSSATYPAVVPSQSRQFQRLETVSQLHLALTDTFIKYALTALPEVPSSFMAAARARATRIHEQVNISAAREFQRRRQSDAFSPRELGIDEELS